MGINFIKENIKKFDDDNLISFLFDVVVFGGLDSVEDYEEDKEYFENDKIYFKDQKGTHHIYKCTVRKATVGDILPNEWIDLLQSFRKPMVTEENIVTSLGIKEEVLTSAVDNQTEFKLSASGVEDGDYTVVVFHPELGRLSKFDFDLAGKFIILKDEFAVEKAGSQLIVDLYSNK